MAMQLLDDKIDRMLSAPLYSLAPADREAGLLELLKEELAYGSERHPGYRSYVEHWPVNYRTAERISDLPYVPVGLLKADPPLSFVAPEEIQKTLTSSATTSQSPSRIVLDTSTSRRMTKGTVLIVRDFIGPTRRPYLVVDTPDQKAGGNAVGARGAAIQGLQPFAAETTYCLGVDQQGGLSLDMNKLMKFAEEKRDAEVLVYGFTWILWNHLTMPLLKKGICLNLKKARLLHSGGWKRLQDQAVDKTFFNEQLAEVVGCPTTSVVDFYGMVESLGVIFPDCPQGNKHAPVFGEVIMRDPLTFEPAPAGEFGIVQICSVLPTSFPGNLLLTEDLAQVVSYDGCRCGRRGVSFRFAGRIAKAEIRGCGNIERKRSVAN